MSLTFNMTSSNKEIIVFINVIYPEGSECTCTQGTKVLYAADTSGQYTFKVSEAGAWEISCSKTIDGEEKSASKTILTDQYKAYSIRLIYDTFETLRADAAANANLSILFSDAAQDYVKWSSWSLVKTGADKVLFIVSDGQNDQSSDKRRVAIISTIDNLGLKVTGGGKLNGPIPMVVNEHTLYVYWGGNTTGTFDLTLHAGENEKKFSNGAVSAWLELSTCEIKCTDSAGGRQQQAQLNDMISRFVYLIENEQS